MSFWKSLFLGAAAFLAVATTVTYTACEKDACTDLKCRNGGNCAEGFCRCKTGYEGAECELKQTDKFLGTYVGYNHCNTEPALIDTVNVFFQSEPNVLRFYRRADSLTQYIGVPSSYNIIVDDAVNGNNRRHVNAIIDGKELTVEVENYTGTTKSICSFVGTRVIIIP